MKKSMSLKDVISFYVQLKNLGIKIWIDGGWGVDALIGEQTRPHSDLDIAIQQKDVQTVCHLFVRFLKVKTPAFRRAAFS